jgi:putative colanic acid biosynthesis acetyltransferase WcaF
VRIQPIASGTNVCISQEALLCTASYNGFSASKFDNDEIAVDESAWIACRSTLPRGVKVGRCATVGARTVGSRSIEPGLVGLAPSAVKR